MEDPAVNQPSEPVVHVADGYKQPIFQKFNKKKISFLLLGILLLVALPLSVIQTQTQQDSRSRASEPIDTLTDEQIALIDAAWTQTLALREAEDTTRRNEDNNRRQEDTRRNGENNRRRNEDNQRNNENNNRRQEDDRRRQEDNDKNRSREQRQRDRERRDREDNRRRNEDNRRRNENSRRSDEDRKRTSEDVRRASEDNRRIRENQRRKKEDAERKEFERKKKSHEEHKKRNKNNNNGGENGGGNNGDGNNSKKDKNKRNKKKKKNNKPKQNPAESPTSCNEDEDYDEELGECLNDQEYCSIYDDPDYCSDVSVICNDYEWYEEALNACFTDEKYCTEYPADPWCAEDPDETSDENTDSDTDSDADQDDTTDEDSNDVSVENDGDQTKERTFSVTAQLPGIVKGSSPTKTEREATLAIYDSENSLVTEINGRLRYNPASGTFTGTFKESLPAGAYSGQVDIPYHMPSDLPGIILINEESTIMTLQQLTLKPGDANDDNSLNIMDYQVMQGCYEGMSGIPVDCDQSRKLGSDLTGDGKVDFIDLNLFLKELSTHRSTR